MRHTCRHTHGAHGIPTCRTYLLAKAAAQQATGQPRLEGDVEWNGASTLLYPALCTFAGVCAGVFGVGGGIVKVRRAPEGVAAPVSRGAMLRAALLPLRACRLAASSQACGPLPAPTPCCRAPSCWRWGSCPRWRLQRQQPWCAAQLQLGAGARGPSVVRCAFPQRVPARRSLLWRVPAPPHLQRHATKQRPPGSRPTSPALQIFFTASAASVVFISFGAVQWDYALVLFALGVGSTAAGQLLVMWVSRHVRSRALLVAIMAVVLGASALALGAQGGAATAAAARHGELWQFHDVCGHSA